MITRSQSETKSLPVCIDFDSASVAWKANKKYMGNGTYTYICNSVCKTGKRCSKSRITNSTNCKQHSKSITEKSCVA